MKRSHGPSRGYSAPGKKAWRDQFWWRASARIGRAKRSSAKIFLIEALDGLEIEKVLKLGFSESNIHVCNGNPAVVATLKKRYNKINTYGTDAASALQRSRTMFDVISLDFCSCLSGSIFETLYAARLQVSTEATVMVNMLRGREPLTVREDLAYALIGVFADRKLWRCYIESLRPESQDLNLSDSHRKLLIANANDLSSNDLQRLLMVDNSLRFGAYHKEPVQKYNELIRATQGYGWALSNHGIYKSDFAGTQTMLWGVFERTPLCITEFNVQWGVMGKVQNEMDLAKRRAMGGGAE